MTKSKPDYIDIDKDGDKTEPMKKAASEAGAKNFKSGGPAKKRGKARGGGAATKGLGYNVN